jgi:hypothetical protein
LNEVQERKETFILAQPVLFLNVTFVFPLPFKGFETGFGRRKEFERRKKPWSKGGFEVNYVEQRCDVSPFIMCGSVIPLALSFDEGCFISHPEK